jgi:HK97 family phage major capsid protein
MNMEELLAALKALIENAEGEGRPLSEEEEEEARSITEKIEAIKATAQYRSLLNAYTTPVRSDLHVHVEGSEVTQELRSFHHYLKTGGFDDYALETRAQTKATGGAGGYLVPTTTQAKIVERMKAFGGILEEVEKITTDSGETMNWATEDDTANVGEIVAEGAAAAGGADKVFGTASLGAFKYEATGTGGLPMKVSWELLEDSIINLEDHIANNFARRIARKLADDVINGDGTTEPEGVIAAKTAFDEITANATGPTYGELLGTVGALDPEYRNGAKWLINDATWMRLLGMVDEQGRPLILPQAQAGLAGGVPLQLLGYPVVIDQAVPAIGDQTKFAGFGNWREAYILRQVNGFHMLRLDELYAVNGFVGFLGWARYDGAVQNPNAYVVLAGENTA